MTIVERIEELVKRNHLSIAELERKAGLPNGQIRRWSTSNPGIDKVEKVADFFNVSVDYLLGRTNNQFTDLPEDIETIAAHIDKDVTKDEIENIKNYIEFIKSQRK
ncbi:hypothetical protein BK128_08340 [Viridibacillus sp. FSL H7-0596]|uniref:helix-turn-helix domain-containing protein n=1 Tax=Viridibacillus sp. FSL H7-0596 TaxID=1928923 RepID=UPI00096E5E5B|nr:helix-turn-helix transcriptional regulator [Viridibacillus sp. FSL H7-0596]OMC87426.1 hypothetical protein BK128_08340 [Viridibacillus sp. FSL H7-0596]